MTIVACSIDSCERKSKARGLCDMHYQRDRKDRFPCSVENCKNGSANTSTGYCGTHHNRLMKHGDPGVTMKGKSHKVKYTDDGLRLCKSCATPKPDSEYHRDKYGTSGRASRCKPCASLYEHERYVANAERIKTRQREYRRKNPTLLKEQDRVNYDRNRDSKIESATKNSHIRRARIASVESDSGLTRLALRKRDGDKCYYCSRAMDFERAIGRKFHGRHASLEHLIPLCSGGSHTFDNCVLACRDCNLSKNAKSIEMFTGFRLLDNEGDGQLTMFDLVG